ncbi:hypothetical protein [Paenibacillus oenotherae]|uniref:hypothetical protein n=1 Tax=Paenibacillus oenotherae TaxID=1435645 RepID=UPI001FE3CE8E|nr:hypothetical protein [Paenibacillus oenotherae]
MQKKAVFKEDEIKRLQRKIKGISEDTNRLRQQINGQMSGWSGDLPVSSMVQQAQRRINKLTDDAEGLADVVSKALQETTRVQQIIGQGTEKLLRTIGSINPLLGQLLQRSVTAHTTFADSFGKKIHHLVTKVIDMFPRDRINSDPVIQKLRAELRQPNLPHPYRIMAEGKLKAILADRELIARMQTAYEVYKKFGNTALMKEAHEQAEKSRQRLRDAGISEELYGAAEDLRRYFPGSEIEACPYDPVTGVLYGSENDRIAMSEDPQYLYLLTLAMQEDDMGKYGKERLKQYLQATNQILPPEFSYDSRGNKIPNYTYNSRGEKIPIPDLGGSTAHQILVNNPDINWLMNKLASENNFTQEEAKEVIYALYRRKKELIKLDSTIKSAATAMGEEAWYTLGERYLKVRQAFAPSYENGSVETYYEPGEFLYDQQYNTTWYMNHLDKDFDEALSLLGDLDDASSTPQVGAPGQMGIGGRVTGRISVGPSGKINSSRGTIKNIEIPSGSTGIAIGKVEGIIRKSVLNEASIAKLLKAAGEGSIDPSKWKATIVVASKDISRLTPKVLKEIDRLLKEGETVDDNVIEQLEITINETIPPNPIDSAQEIPPVGGGGSGGGGSGGKPPANGQGDGYNGFDDQDDENEGTGKPSSNFANRELLEGHYEKHGGEFKGSYKNADEYLQGANDVMNGGTKVQYEYKLKNGTVETRTGYVKFMGNTQKGEAKFEFVGTNTNGDITTYHVKRGEDLWKLLNGNKHDKSINPFE